MGQRQGFTRSGVDAEGNVILERTYTDDVKKDDVLEKLNQELEDAMADRARANKRITKIQNRIDTVTAL
jgi:ribosomal protein L17